MFFKMIDTDIHRVKRRFSAFRPDDVVIIENQKVMFFGECGTEKTKQKNQQTRFFKVMDCNNKGRNGHEIRIAKRKTHQRVTMLTEKSVNRIE